ncbi:hypothetical protein QVD17_36561 [Tagetes erecta]|uniref:Transmembrane protein n=1 Tax=Tagetes erecta TaxID=13708 RepID=A0AAD8NHH1_TARER|nr:hypothetical protein QVD17_36561 [Tagetes erecta]
MSDWGPVFVAVVLFILLTPGLLIQIPGHNKVVEFGNFQTSGVSILVHSVIYFALMCIFLLAIGIHLYLGKRNRRASELLCIALICINLWETTSVHVNTLFHALVNTLNHVNPQFNFTNLPPATFFLCIPCSTSSSVRASSETMADWGPVLIGVVLFVLLQPGLLFQLPGNSKQLEFGSMRTNRKAIGVHTLIFFTIYAILVLAVHVHIYTG